MQREVTVAGPYQALSTSPHQHAMRPAATAPGYHYSPDYDDSRRMSETLTMSANPSPGSQLGGVRRPSAPMFARSSLSALSSTLIDLSTPRNQQAQNRPLEQSPGGTTNVSQSPSPRPRIMRYKTSPARYTGLGLEISLRAGPSVSGPSSAGSQIDPREVLLSASRRSIDSTAEAPAQTATRRRSSGRDRGHWAAVDYVDTLTPSDLEPTIASSVSSGSSKRGSIMLSLARNVMGRGRFDSVDSAVPQPRREAFEREHGRWSDTLNLSLPTRRGSLAVIAFGDAAGVGQFGGVSGVGGAGRAKAPSGSWQDRRGSWAEGWARN